MTSDTHALTIEVMLATLHNTSTVTLIAIADQADCNDSSIKVFTTQQTKGSRARMMYYVGRRTYWVKHFCGLLNLLRHVRANYKTANSLHSFPTI